MSCVEEERVDFQTEGTIVDLFDLKDLNKKMSSVILRKSEKLKSENKSLLIEEIITKKEIQTTIEKYFQLVKKGKQENMKQKSKINKKSKKQKRTKNSFELKKKQ